MKRKEAMKLLPGLPPDEMERIFAEAQKAAGSPKSKQYQEKSTGVYNAVALPEITARVVSVKDADKKPPNFEQIGQQVVCSRNLKPPVVVEYVLPQDVVEHDAKIARELERLRPR